jgi:transcriptional regulator with XRE-family HTH domain
MYDLGIRLKELRENKKVTQTQVAKRLNLHKSSIYGYENNIRPPSLGFPYYRIEKYFLTQLVLLLKIGL